MNIPQKLLIILQLAINLVVVVFYTVGFVPFRYFSFGWVCILGIVALYLINSTQKPKSPKGFEFLDLLMFQNRSWIGANLILSFLSFIPVFGWVAMFMGLKFCFDDINYLWRDFRDQNPNKPKSTFEQFTQSINSSFYSDKTKKTIQPDVVIDVEAK